MKRIVFACIALAITIIFYQSIISDIKSQTLTPPTTSIDYEKLMSNSFIFCEGDSEANILRYFPEELSFDNTAELSSSDLLQISALALSDAYSTEIRDTWKSATVEGYDVPLDAVHTVLNHILINFDTYAIHNDIRYNQETHTVYFPTDSLKDTRTQHILVHNKSTCYPTATSKLLFQACLAKYNNESVYELAFTLDPSSSNLDSFAYIAVSQSSVRVAAIERFPTGTITSYE